MKMQLDFVVKENTECERTLPSGSPRSTLIRHCSHADDFARLTLGHDLEWAAANFTIRSKSLAVQAGINGHLARLSAVGTLNIGKLFHAAILTIQGQSANL